VTYGQVEGVDGVVLVLVVLGRLCIQALVNHFYVLSLHFRSEIPDK
jgi:hypothetical protein